MPAHLTDGMSQQLKGGFFQGSVKPGKKMAFKFDKHIGPFDLLEHIDFSEDTETVTLVAETFKFPLNFDFDTLLCHQLLHNLKDASNEFFEITDIDTIIDVIFERYKMHFIMMNLGHIIQAILVSFFIFNKESQALRIAMYIVAGINILIELI